MCKHCVEILASIEYEILVSNNIFVYYAFNRLDIVAKEHNIHMENVQNISFLWIYWYNSTQTAGHSIYSHFRGCWFFSAFFQIFFFIFFPFWFFYGKLNARYCFRYFMEHKSDKSWTFWQTYSSDLESWVGCSRLVL